MGMRSLCLRATPWALLFPTNSLSLLFALVLSSSQNHGCQSHCTPYDDALLLCACCSVSARMRFTCMPSLLQRVPGEHTGRSRSSPFCIAYLCLYACTRVFVYVALAAAPPMDSRPNSSNRRSSCNFPQICSLQCRCASLCTCPAVKTATATRPRYKF
jgi:hypothetical protein